jgi:hypothetical protein
MSAYAPSQTGVSEPLSMADYRFRSYPFPMPPGSLPSLAPDTPVGSTSLNAEAKVTDTERPARPQSFSHSSPLIPPHLMPPDTTQSSPAHQFHSSPQVRFQPSPKVRPHSPHPHPVHQAANVL